MSFYFPVERELTNNDLEAYAHGCYDILKKLGIFDGHCKAYDPLTIENNTAHSYVFNLQDGGRHHPFESLEQLRIDILSETVNLIIENQKTLSVTPASQDKE